MSRDENRAGKFLPTLLLTAVAVTCVVIAGLWLGRTAAQREESAIVERPARRDFALTDTTGAPVSLETYKGKWMLMFFGFTSCPEACPMALTNVTETLKELGAYASNLQPVFVSVDPERDTREVVKDYISHFDERIAGLTGTPEAVADMTKLYGVYYRKRAVDGGDYTIDHSTAFYLVSPTGEFLRAFTPDMDPADFARDLKTAMGKGASS